MKSYLFFGVIFCVLLCGCKSLENDFEYFIQKYYQNNQLNAEDRHRLINILKSEKILDTLTLMQIVVDKKYELLDLLEQFACANISAEQCDILIGVCCDADVMKRVLSFKNSDPHKKETRLGRTVLFVHARDKQCNSIKTLLEVAFCDVNAKDYRGFSPAHICAYSGSIDNLKELIKWHADIFAQSYSGKTLLHVAAMRYDDDVEMIKFLLSQGLNINAKDAWGNTALFYAYSKGNKKIMDFLLRHGANPKIKNNKNFLYNEVLLKDDVANVIF